MYTDHYFANLVHADRRHRLETAAATHRFARSLRRLTNASRRPSPPSAAEGARTPGLVVVATPPAAPVRTPGAAEAA